MLEKPLMTRAGTAPVAVRRCQGIGLIDVLIAVVIVGVGLITFLTAISHDFRNTRSSKLQLTGQSVAHDILEHYARYQGFNVLNATQTPYTLNVSAADFPPLASLPDGLATVFVDYWYSPGAKVLPAANRSILLVRVTVTWTPPAGGPTQSTQLSTFAAREGFDKTG